MTWGRSKKVSEMKSFFCFTVLSSTLCRWTWRVRWGCLETQKTSGYGSWPAPNAILTRRWGISLRRRCGCSWKRSAEQGEGEGVVEAAWWWGRRGRGLGERARSRGSRCPRLGGKRHDNTPQQSCPFQDNPHPPRGDSPQKLFSHPQQFCPFQDKTQHQSTVCLRHQIN